MGRFGEGVYGSDSSLDYFSDIGDRIVREIMFWTSPEQIFYGTRWIIETITIVEVILIFDKYQIGSPSFLMDRDLTVKRWRKDFFGVWDAEWDEPLPHYVKSADEGYPFRTYDNRVQHREVMVQWFDRLEELATYWTEDEPADLTLFDPKNLPYFILQIHGRETRICSGFVGNLLETLIREIVFNLSDENHDNAVGFFEIEYVWVSLDIMTCLCDAYAMSPGVGEETATKWLEQVTAIWKERWDDEGLEWDEDDYLYKMVVDVFDRFRAVARQYPDAFSI